MDLFLLSILCVLPLHPVLYYRFFFFFNDTATTEIYTLSLHDALPIYRRVPRGRSAERVGPGGRRRARRVRAIRDWKSTRLNSSHSQISYAVFCLKKKKKHERRRRTELKTLIHSRGGRSRQ